MYEARFTTKQVYDNYAKSVSKPKNANQQAARTMSSVGIGSLGGKTTTASAKKIQDSFKEKRERRRKNKGSTYDEVPQVLTQGIVKRPAPKPSPEKTTGYEKVKRIFNSAMERFGIIDEPTSTYDTVKPQKIYKDNRYFGPAVFMPNTSNFKGDTDFTNYVPKILENLGVVSVRTGDYLDSSTLPTDVDNPSLNMFGVSRGFTKPPAGLMSPPSVEMPANLDPISRALSLAFRPPSMPTTAEYTVSEGESLLTVLDTLNAGKPNSQKVTLEEIGKLNNIPDVVADPFGKIKKGDVLQIPIKKQTAVGDLRDQIEKERSIKRAIIEFERLPESEKKNIRERYRLRKEAQPASYTEEENKILKELERLDKDVANYVREFFDKQSEERLQKLAEEVGVDIKGKDVSGFGGMGPDPAEQFAEMNVGKIKTDYVDGYLKGHEGVKAHASLEGGKDTAAYGVKNSLGLKRSDYKSDRDFAAAVALKHYNQTKNDFIFDFVWDELGEAGRYALTDLHYNAGTVGSSAVKGTAKEAITNTLNYVGMTTKDGTKASLLSLSKRRAENWNKAAKDLGLDRIDKIQQMPRAGGGTIIKYLNAEGDVIHQVSSGRKPITLRKNGTYKKLTETKEVKIN